MATDPKNAEAIKNGIIKKLMEIDKYGDEELSDYIMVMIANKKHKDDMKRDLNLFLAEETSNFLNWLIPFLKDFERAAHEKHWKPAMGGGRGRGRTPSPLASHRPREGNRGLRDLADDIETNGDSAKDNNRPKDNLSDAEEDRHSEVFSSSGEEDEEGSGDSAKDSNKPKDNLSDAEEDRHSEVFSSSGEEDEEGRKTHKERERKERQERAKRARQMSPRTKADHDRRQQELIDKAKAGTLKSAQAAAGSMRSNTVRDDDNRRLYMARDSGMVPRDYGNRDRRGDYRDRDRRDDRRDDYRRRDDRDRDRRDVIVTDETIVGTNEETIVVPQEEVPSTLKTAEHQEVQIPKTLTQVED